MATRFIACVAALISIGCAAPQQKQCGRFDTDQVRADLKQPFRTDREWHETLIEMLARQMDCERSLVTANAPHEGPGAASSRSVLWNDGFGVLPAPTFERN